jgi:hypothetical protein
MSAPPLTLLDKHRASVDVPPERVWDALRVALADFTHAGLARVLGSSPGLASGDLRVVGSSIPGFEVTESSRPTRLVLSGRHRVATYSLVFTVFDRGPGSGTGLVAASYATFHGPAGRMFRAVAIDTGLHRMMVRRLLRRLCADVERRR